MGISDKVSGAATGVIANRPVFKQIVHRLLRGSFLLAHTLMELFKFSHCRGDVALVVRLLGVLQHLRQEALSFLKHTKGAVEPSLGLFEFTVLPIYSGKRRKGRLSVLSRAKISTLRAF